MKSIITAALMLVAVTIASPSAFAMGTDVGSNVLERVNAKDHNGKDRDFASISGEKGVVIVFSRSLDWCPYCKKQAIGLKKKTADFDSVGYKIALVTYDKSYVTKSFVDKHDLRYPVLYDQDSQLIKSFGLLNEKYQPDSKYYGIPHPAVFVVNKEGVVTHRYQEEGYKSRPDLDEIYLDLQR